MNMPQQDFCQHLKNYQFKLEEILLTTYYESDFNPGISK